MVHSLRGANYQLIRAMDLNVYALLTLQSQEWYTKAAFGSYVGQGNCGA